MRMSHQAPSDTVEPSGLDLLGDDPTLYKQVFDNPIVGICFMAERRFVRMNRRLEEMLGYDPGELLGRSVRQVYAREEDYQEVGQLVATLPRRSAYNHERALVGKDGSLRWCLIGGRWLNPSDPQSPSIWVVQDITSKKAAEDQLARANQRLEHRVEQRTVNLRKTNEALKQEVVRRRDSERAMIESREKYRVLLRNIPLGIAITDVHGDIVEINPVMQSWFNAPNLEAFVARSSEIPCALDGEETSVSLRELVRSLAPGDGRRPGHVTVSCPAASGESMWFDVVGVRVPVSGLGAAVVFADQTAQRHARDRELAQQQQLAHATRLSLMGQFASALAHELGQPLNASLSYAAGIERRLEKVLQAQPEAADALEHLQLHLRQAGDVIKNVRTFVTRHRAGEEAIDLSVLIHSTLDLLQLQLRESATRVRVQSDDIIPKVAGNRVELQQVLVNLIVNAIDAADAASVRQPEVRISLSRQRGSWVQVMVADNGPGIPAELHDQIFEPYNSTKQEGLGLGLTMCRNIVEAHGGKLSLDHRARRGACFRFTLRTIQPEDGPASAADDR
jgi:PAS domain S-box-containing protein